MDKTTCFSAFRQKTNEESDCESLAPEDEEDDESSDPYTPHIMQDLTEEAGIDDDEEGITTIISIKSRCQSLRAVILSGHGYLCIYVGLVLLFLGAAVSLVLVCLQIVRPYISVLNYRRSNCYTIATVHDGIRGCMCGIGCNNKYNCIVITVKYLYNPVNNTWVNATMYEDESLISAKCSFFPPCRSSQARIDITMSKYVKEYGKIGQQHTCYHSNDMKDFVIRKHRYHTYHVIHGLLWTSLAIIVAVSVFIYTLRRKKSTVV